MTRAGRPASCALAGLVLAGPADRCTPGGAVLLPDAQGPGHHLGGMGRFCRFLGENCGKTSISITP